MRFSVLLPTRNGGSLIEACIRSVLEQDHVDFELVVSDNANTDSTQEILRRFAGDARLKVLRQDQLLPVHENWTAAFDAAAGDYVLMMGDDDYLLPGSLTALDAVLRKYDNPDCVLFNGYSYVAPDAIAGRSTSYWAPYHFAYGADFPGEGAIEHARRKSIVRDMFKFRQRVPLNMQTTLFARRAAAVVPGGVFQPPFPDHYLLNALLMSADQWVYFPNRLVVVGVSSKSFGHYFYSQNAAEGLAYLGISTDFPAAIPGNDLLNGMCLWLMRLKERYRDELAGIDIDRPGYLIRQTYFWLLQYRYRRIGTRDLVHRFGMLAIRDWILLIRGAIRPSIFLRLFRSIGVLRKSHAEALWNNLVPLEGPRDIREFAQWLDR